MSQCEHSKKNSIDYQDYIIIIKSTRGIPIEYNCAPTSVEATLTARDFISPKVIIVLNQSKRLKSARDGFDGTGKK